MPRVSLPSSLKHLKTFQVILSETNEDELRSHFNTLFNIFEAKKYVYENRVSMAVNVFLDGNPYLKNDWKKGKPKRPFKESLAWFGENEAEIAEYMGFNQLLSDLITIKKNYNWDDLDNMIFELEKFTNYMRTNQNDLAQLENYKYNYAKNKFEDENKEWIDEQKLIHQHSTEHKYCFMLQVREKQGEDISEFLECKYCKIQYDKDVERFNKAEEYQRKANEAWEMANAHRLVNNEENKVEKKTDKLEVQLHCEDCDFKTYYQNYFDIHLDEPMHKQAINRKALYCNFCECQSRTQKEYDNHILTKKHSNNVNGKTEYFCEKCNYKTLLKNLYDQHCETKKHKE